MKAMFNTVDQMQVALSYHQGRHAVLAGNLANLDTPGYIPFDLTLEHVAPESGTGTLAMAMAQTTGGHFIGEQPGMSKAQNEAFLDTSGGPGADGNWVTLERELAKIDANRIRYATTTELVSRRLALLRYAAGDGV